MSLQYNRIACVKFMYKFAKIHGLIPFNYCDQTNRATLSIASTIHSIIITLFVGGSLVFATNGAFQLIFASFHNAKVITNLVFLMQIILSGYRVIDFYIFQLINRKRYVLLIDKVVGIGSQLKKLYGSERFMIDETIKIQCFYKFCLVLIQICLMLSTLYTYKRIILDTEQQTSIFTSAIIYTYSNILKMWLLTFYFGCFIVILQFYRCINQELWKIVHSINRINSFGKTMKIIIYCDLIDKTYGIADVIDKVNDLCNEFVIFYSLQILLALLDNCFTILYEVSKLLNPSWPFFAYYRKHNKN